MNVYWKPVVNQMMIEDGFNQQLQEVEDKIIAWSRGELSLTGDLLETFVKDKVSDYKNSFVKIVMPFQEISLLHTFVEQDRLLADVRIDPHTDLDPLFLDPPQHPLRVRKYPFIPDKIRPVKFPHPAAVKVEHTQRNPPLQHAVDKAHHRFLVIICGK